VTESFVNFLTKLLVKLLKIPYQDSYGHQIYLIFDFYLLLLTPYFLLLQLTSNYML